MDPDDPPGFPDAGLGRGRGHIAVLEFGKLLPEDVDEGEDILPKFALRRREIAVVAGIRRRPGNVDRDAPLMEHIVEPGSSEIGEISPFLFHFE